MTTTHLNPLPYPAVLHRAHDAAPGFSRVRASAAATPLDRLAQRIARSFDVALVEFIDERRQRSVFSGRCATVYLEDAGDYPLAWSREVPIASESGRTGRLVLRDRAHRSWNDADTARLAELAALAGCLMETGRERDHALAS